MYLVLIDITHYRSLRKVEPELIDRIDQHLAKLYPRKRGQLLNNDAGFLLLGFPESHNGDFALVGDFLWETFNFLEENKKELYGFNLLVGKSLQSRENPLADMKASLLHATLSDNIWFEETAAETLQLYFQAEKGEYLYRVTGLIEIQKSLIGRKSVFYERDNPLAELVDELGKWKRSSSEYNSILLKGETGTGRYFNLVKALDDVFCLKDSPPFALMDCPIPHGEVTFPLRGAIHEEYIDRIPEYLESTELSEWNRNPGYRHLLICISQGQLAPFSMVDLFRSLYFYFLVYSRHLRILNIAPVVVMQDFPLFTDSLKRILKEVFALFVPKKLINLVVITKKNTIKGLDLELKERIISFTSLSKEELDEKETKLGFVKSKNPGLLLKKLDGRLMPTFHNFIMRDPLKTDSIYSTLDPSLALLKESEGGMAICLYIISISLGLLSEPLFIKFMTDYGYEEAYLRDKLRILTILGYIRDTQPLFTVLHRLKDDLAKDLGYDAKHLESALSNFLWNEFNQEIIKPNIWLYFYFERQGDVDRALEVFRALAKVYFENDQKSSLENLLYDTEHFKNTELTESQIQSIDDNLFILKLKFSLFYYGVKPTNKLVKTQEIKRGGGYLESRYPMEFSEYHLAKGDEQLAFDLLKRTLVDHQDEPGYKDLWKIYIKLGFVLIQRKSIADGLDYLEMAIGYTQGSDYGWILTRYYLALAFLLIGRYDRSLNLVQESIKRSSELGYKKWYCHNLFLLSRLQMSLGNYEECRQVFTNLARETKIQKWHEFRQLVDVWQARILIYEGKAEEAYWALNEINTEDAKFFQVEALYTLGEYIKAENLLDKMIKSKPPEYFLPVDYPQFNSGFDLFEERLVKKVDNSFAHRIKRLQVWKNLLTAKQGNLEGAVVGFQRWLSNEALSQKDPNNSLYLFFYYSILPHDKTSQWDDPITILNKSYKLMQERASENQDARVKLSYLRKEYWNCRIIAEAKENRLC